MGVGASGTETGAGARRRRVGPAVVVSLLAHAAALGWLALKAAPRGPEPSASQPEFQVELIKPPTPTSAADTPGAVSSRRVAVRESTSLATAPAPPAAAPLSTSLSAHPLQPPPSSTPSSPADAAGARTAGADAISASPGPGAAAVDLRGLLRGALGCDHAQLMDLSPAERSRCAERLGLVARTAPKVDAMPVEKRACYDALVAAREEAGGLPASAGDIPMLHSHGMDATVGYGCKIALGADAARTNRRNGIKLGFPPCPIHPPSSVLSSETRTPPPESLRDREEDARRAALLNAPLAHDAPKP